MDRPAIMASRCQGKKIPVAGRPARETFPRRAETVPTINACGKPESKMAGCRTLNQRLRTTWIVEQSCKNTTRSVVSRSGRSAGEYFQFFPFFRIRMQNYDALLFVSFGGPEGPDDVLPFLENVLRGKNVPRERMLEVSEHYQAFGGVSPINEQNRKLIGAIEQELSRHGMDLPVYWGNRNWYPMIPEALEQIRKDGHRRVLAFMTSAFSCYSGCRQYREDLQKAQVQIGDTELSFGKIRAFYNHPGFVEAFSERVQESLSHFEQTSSVKILFTAHSIPDAMANHCAYAQQLQEACQLVCEKLGHDDFELVFQSRSGPPHQPWLEPDVCDRVAELAAEGQKELVIAPIGFISDHMEVLFDLDTEARELCDQHGIRMERTPTVGTHPRFVRMVRELIEERQDDALPRQFLGSRGAVPDVCPANCCLSGRPTGQPGRPAAEAKGGRPES